MDKSPIVTRINSLLAQKGITKAEFYEKCELTSASYSQWNTGKTKPRLRTIERIAKFLDVSSEYLLYGNTAPEPPQRTKKAPTEISERDDLCPAAERIVDILKVAPQAELDKILGYVEFLQSKWGEKK